MFHVVVATCVHSLTNAGCDIYIYKTYITHTHTYIYIYIYIYMGARFSVVVKALCYKPEGPGFDS
jgi:hypothetical protein